MSARPSWPRRSPRISGRRLLRLQCYEGQDETKALYEWEYGKQLLYTQILRDKIGQVVADAPDLESAVDRIGAQESVFFSERFLAARPLLEAIRSDKPCVLLIDEVDRADEALEAVLLETLAEFQVTVPEVGTFTTDTTPVRDADLQQHARPLRRAQAALPAPLPGLPLGGARTGDRPLQGHRSARGAGQAAGGHRPRAARAGAAQGALDLRDHRLGPHAGRARHGRAQRHRPRGHRVGRRQVRQGRPQGHRRYAATRRPQRDGARNRPRPRARPRGGPRCRAPPTAPTSTRVLACVRRRTGWAGTARGYGNPVRSARRCRGRSPAGAARRHLEPGQPLFGLGRKRAL